MDDPVTLSANLERRVLTDRRNSLHDEWVAIDFETANSARGSACAVGMTMVKDGEVCERLFTLVRPTPPHDQFDPFNVSLHGITEERVRAAPEWGEAVGEIMAFADGRPLVAHNAAFDMGVIRSACSAAGMAWPELRFVCTLVIARRTWELLSYRLPFVAEAANVPLLDHHDASADADAAANIMIAAMKVHRVNCLEELLRLTRVTFGQQTNSSWSGSVFAGSSPRSAIPAASPDADPDGLLYGATACFTGTLSTMTRSQAYRLLAEAGGQPTNAVNRKTDLLVVGVPDPTRFAPGMVLSGKQLKAQQLRASGHGIEMIGEDDFLALAGS